MFLTGMRKNWRGRSGPSTPDATARLSPQTLPEEFRFHVVKNLQSKQVLDMGCGDGHNSVLSTNVGARVTGIDILPRSIELAKRRAEQRSEGRRRVYLFALGRSKHRLPLHCR